MRCPLCSRPDDQCVCGHVRAASTGVQVAVVQHPGERHHAFNTARLTQRCLAGATLDIAWPDADGRMACRPALADDAVLLFPREDAVEVDRWVGPVPSQLVVLDGTWSQVKRLQHDNPWLAELPAVSLPLGAPSRYRIREEPEAHFLSTLEAVARVLAAWAPDGEASEVLLGAFEALVDAHVAVKGAPTPRRKQRSRATVQERLEAWEDVVVAYAETVGLGADRRLLQWAAVRPATGEVFDRVVTVEGMNPCVFAATELPEGADGDLASLRRAWHDWRREEDHVFAWTSALGRVGGPAGLGVGVYGLKALLGRVGKAGRLDEVVAREGLAADVVPVRGRAGRRLGWALALAAWLRDTGGRTA